MNQQPTPSQIRQFVDGELSPEHAAKLERMLRDHPELREDFEVHARFERLLRKRVAAAMLAQAPEAPEGLAERVRAAWAAEQLIAASAVPKPALPVRKQVTAAGYKRQGLFANPYRANVLAVAATLLLITGAVLWGIFGRTIDDVATPSERDVLADLAMFVDEEHVRLAHSDRLHDWLQYATFVDAQQQLSQWLGVPIGMFDLTDLGYSFAAGGTCNLPASTPAGHLMYRKEMTNGERQPMVSLFVAPKRGGCSKISDSLDPAWKAIDPLATGCKKTILCASDGEVVYLLVCCENSDVQAVSGSIAAAFERPGCAGGQPR